MFTHRALDPRSKLTFALVVSTLAILTSEFEALGIVATALVLLVAAGQGLGIRDWLGFLSALRVLVPVIFVLNLLFYANGTVLWRLRPTPLRITVGGLETSTFIILRLLIIAGLAAWFAKTTESEEFEVALVGLGIPWPLAFSLSLTLRLLPEIRDRYNTVEDAQRSRGLEIDGGPISQAKARIPMLLPFFVSIIEYGYELADALEVRDFGQPTRRTSLVSLQHERADFVLYGLSAALLLWFGLGFETF